MLTLTDAAADYFHGLLEQGGLPDHMSIRVAWGDEGMFLQVDKVRPGDETFTRDERVILLLDEQVATALSGSKIDLEPSESGPRVMLS